MTGHGYTLVSVLALIEAVCRGQGIVTLRELSLAVQATMLGEVISPFIVQDKSVTANIRTTVDDQCL